MARGGDREPLLLLLLAEEHSVKPKRAQVTADEIILHARWSLTELWNHLAQQCCGLTQAQERAGAVQEAENNQN